MLNRAVFFREIRGSLFRGRFSQKQVEGINGVLDAWEEFGSGVDRHLGYTLATVYHETGTRMVPVREGFASSDAKARRVVRHRKYGRPAGPYRHVYYGRGHPQLTWHSNYVDSSDDAGGDLEKNPDLMLDPLISARVLVKGILDGRWNGRGHGLGRYLTEKKEDYKNARRTVNITDKWSLIKGYSIAFEEAIATARAAGDTVAEVTTPETTEKPKSKSTTIWSVIGGVLSTIGSAFTAVIGLGESQPVLAGAIIVMAFLTVGFLAWIFRERIKKMVEEGV